jgi:hypothetical protein
MNYENLKEFRKEFVSWIAALGLVLAGLEFYLTPTIEKMIKSSEGRILSHVRAESHRNQYNFYSEFAHAYKAIPDPKPHQKARLDFHTSKRDYYLGLMQDDYKKGILIE